MAIPTAQMTRRRYGAGKLWAYTLGTAIATGSYAPVGTAGTFTQGTSATNVPGSASWLPLGITTEGMTLTYSFDTEQDESAEYYTAHKTMITGTAATLGVTLKQVNLTNLRLAFNAATSAVTGTPNNTTGVFKMGPPVPGSEVRCQLLWESLNNDLVIVGFQALQTNEISLGGRKGAEGMNLDLSFTLETPDPAINSTGEPFFMYGTGTSWAETVSTD